MLGSMASAVDTLKREQFNQTSCLAVRTWAHTGVDYITAVYGHRFQIAKGAKLESLDNLTCGAPRSRECRFRRDGGQKRDRPGRKPSQTTSPETSPRPWLA
jgi:hypothetical protein